MKRGKNHYKVSFGIEFDVCLKAMIDYRDKLINGYIASTGKLTPGDMEEMAKRYQTCIGMIHTMEGWAYNIHGLCPKDETDMSPEQLNAAVTLESYTNIANPKSVW